MRIEFKNIKKGDVFYECEAGQNIRCVALEDAREINDKSKGQHGYVLKVAFQKCVWSKLGGVTRFEYGPTHQDVFFESYEPGAYGLKIYSEPQYIQF